MLIVTRIRYAPETMQKSAEAHNAELLHTASQGVKRVTYVAPASPAFRAGVAVGDTVLALNGASIATVKPVYAQALCVVWHWQLNHLRVPAVLQTAV